jgi:Domain of unknown function (DUF6457)
MDAWLQKVSDALGAGDLTEEDADALLKIAAIAAHESGERTNAPLLCFLVGRAQAGRPLDEILDTVRTASKS